MRTERELLIDCLERLNRSGIPYMLVGSMASNYWSIPRTTHDLYFVLAIASQDVDRAACMRSKEMHSTGRIFASGLTA